MPVTVTLAAAFDLRGALFRLGVSVGIVDRVLVYIARPVAA